MDLLPPRVIGPLSECSQKVRVEGQVAGADIEVRMDGSTVVASGPSPGPGVTLTVTSPLKPGSKITALQRLGSDTSDQSPEPVTVQAKPNEIGMVGFRSNIIECGECLWIEGAVPGADVSIEQDSVHVGTRNSYDGNARIRLSEPIKPGSKLVAQQEACSTRGQETLAPPAESATGKREEGTVLPAPIVESPLQACRSRVTVSNVIHGATVVLKRSVGPDIQACFDLSSLWMGLNPPLAEGETLFANQQLKACAQFSPDSDAVVVGPLEPIPIPHIVEPLCAEGTTVPIDNLVFGSHIEITVAPGGHGDAPGVGGPVYSGSAPNDGRFDFPIPPLPAHAIVYVRQELCGRWSDYSEEVKVHKAPDKLNQPKIPGPLFECAAVVHVENLHPGTRVYVWSRQLEAPIGEQHVYSDEADVPVAPLLIAEDEIFAIAIGCGLESERSNSVSVRKLDRLEPPEVVAPVYACPAPVKVKDVVPGARVDIYINDIWAGTALAGESEVEVPVQVGEIQVGDVVKARQRFCNRVTALGKGVVAEEFLGRWFVVGSDEDEQKDKAKVLAVHAALLPNNKILYFGGDQHDKDAHVAGDVDNTRLFDCSTHAVTEVEGLEANMFCAGHAFLEDGSLLVAGGTAGWPQPEGHLHVRHFLGERTSLRFVHNPSDGVHWKPTGRLNTERASTAIQGANMEDTGGRWYPTLVTLPDGRVLAIGGHPLASDSRHTNLSLELYDPADGEWHLVGEVDYENIPGGDEFRSRSNHSEYPRLHTLSDGTVFSVSPMADGTLEKWNPYTNPTDWDHVANPAEIAYSDKNPQGAGDTSVLLPLRHSNSYRSSVLICGRATPWTIDLNASSPAWSSVARTFTYQGVNTPRRRFLNATTLPTGQVVLTGGVRDSEDDATGVLPAEMYDPTHDSWKVLASASVVRNYHSTALLMPNGSIWTAGSNINAKSGGRSVREYRIEIFEPWYFCYPRPRITEVSDSARAGTELTVRTPDAARICEVVLVRCGSATHAFNSDQRHVEPEFVWESGELLQVKLPTSDVLVPGYYLVFVLDKDRVPSTGHYVKIRAEAASSQGSKLQIDIGELIDSDIFRRIVRGIRINPDLIRRR